MSIDRKQGEEKEELVLSAAHAESRAQILTLNRYTNRNALSQPMIDALLAKLTRASVDPSVHAIVITGANGFFSGMLYSF